MLYIWIFGFLAEVGVEQNLDKKQPVRSCQLFLNLGKKNITGFDIWKGLCGNLEHPNIWLSEHLDR
jgi:hypothetical protein